MSDWRMSLFADPMRGDAASNTVDSPYPTNGTYKPELYTPVPLSEVMYGFYADGFFDRRPIKEKTMVDGTTRGEGTLGYTKYRGVSLDNADAAYGGVLVYNSNTSASIFFRLREEDGIWMVVWNMPAKRDIIGLPLLHRGGLR